MRCISTQRWRSIFSRLGGGFCLILWALGSAPVAASAASIFFSVGNDGYAFGVSEADAMSSGLPIIDSAVAVDGENLSITAPQTVPGSVFKGPPGGATQNFGVTNESAPDATHPDDQLFLVLKGFDTSVVDTGIAGVGEVSWDYLGSFSGPSEDPGTLATVGFELSDAWSIVSFLDGELNQTLYFPAISLGALAQDDSTTVSISFLLTDPKTAFVLEGGELLEVLMLPVVFFDAAFIPEPSTGLLLTLGLCGLAWRGAGRSCRPA